MFKRILKAIRRKLQERKLRFQLNGAKTDEERNAVIDQFLEPYGYKRTKRD